MQIGYARVSTESQTNDPQEDELRAAGCERIFTDTASGAKADRPGLDSMLSQVRRGDVLTVVRLDRLGRSLSQLLATVEKLDKGKVGLRSLAERIDTTSAGGKLIFHLFGALAEFERGLIRDRVQAGLAAARARGRIGGRPRKADGDRQRMAAALMADPKNTARDVCRLLKVSRATAFRLARAGQRAAQVQPPAAPAAKPPRKAAQPAQAASPPNTAKPTTKGTKTTTKPASKRK